jgi:group I intron endonuclease
MEKKIVIYKITNPNGRVYIGQTVDFERRLDKYRRLKCKSQHALYASMCKYGFDSHIFEIIEEFESPSLLDSREIFYIDLYKSNKSRYPDKNGMNLTDGGHGTRGLKFKWKKESIYKISGSNHWAFGKPKPYTSERNRLKKGTKNPAHSIRMMGRSLNAKLVLNVETGIYYDSAKEAAVTSHLSLSHFRACLSGKSRVNYTSFKYV